MMCIILHMLGDIQRVHVCACVSVCVSVCGCPEGLPRVLFAAVPDAFLRLMQRDIPAMSQNATLVSDLSYVIPHDALQTIVIELRANERRKSCKSRCGQPCGLCLISSLCIPTSSLIRCNKDMALQGVPIGTQGPRRMWSRGDAICYKTCCNYGERHMMYRDATCSASYSPNIAPLCRANRWGDVRE